MGGSPSADELRAQIERQRSELGRDLEVLGDKVSPGRMMDRRKEAVRQRTRGWKDRIMGATDSATTRVSDTGHAVGQRLHHAPMAAEHQIQGNPLAAGLVAFGAGAVLAALLPTSEKERRMAQQATPALERAAEEAGSIAMQAKDDLQPMAQEAMQHVKDDAQQAAERVKQDAQGAAQEVKTTAQPSSSGPTAF
jgi:ElaB/YqjD/DUF883 family membrane-anchored ribosome-binding protein